VLRDGRKKKKLCEENERYAQEMRKRAMEARQLHLETLEMLEVAKRKGLEMQKKLDTLQRRRKLERMVKAFDTRIDSALEDSSTKKVDEKNSLHLVLKTKNLLGVANSNNKRIMSQYDEEFDIEPQPPAAKRAQIEKPAFPSLPRDGNPAIAKKGISLSDPRNKRDHSAESFFNFEADTGDLDTENVPCHLSVSGISTLDFDASELKDKVEDVGNGDGDEEKMTAVEERDDVRISTNEQGDDVADEDADKLKMTVDEDDVIITEVEVGDLIPGIKVKTEREDRDEALSDGEEPDNVVPVQSEVILKNLQVRLPNLTQKDIKKQSAKVKEDIGKQTGEVEQVEANPTPILVQLKQQFKDCQDGKFGKAGNLLLANTACEALNSPNVIKAQFKMTSSEISHCPRCSKRFTSKSDFRNHKLHVHTSWLANSPGAENNLKAISMVEMMQGRHCYTCTHSVKGSVTRHVMFCRGTANARCFGCPDCSLVNFTSSRDAEQHYMTCTEGSTLKCVSCHTPYNLEKHIDRCPCKKVYFNLY